MKLDVEDPILKLISLAKDNKSLIKVIAILLKKDVPLDYIRTTMNRLSSTD